MTKIQTYKTVSHVFLDARQKPVTQVAFRHSDGTKWSDISWPEYFNLAQSLACGLSSLGIKRGDRVAIMSNTRYQWAVSDMAILGMGCVSVPVYQNNTPEDTAFIINNSEAKVIFVEDEVLLSKIISIKDQTPNLKHIVTFQKSNSTAATNWDDILKKGKEFSKLNPKFFEDECLKNKLSEMATIVYTSGTTGQPKGVVLLHSCIASECEEIKTILNLSDADTTLTFLPFAHIFGRVELWANVYIGWKMGFAESIDRISANLTEIKPTFMMAVPRIFEKIYSKIISQVEEGSPLKKKIFLWAVNIGKQVSLAKRNKEHIPLSLMAQYEVAYKLVFSKLNAKLGGKLRYLVSGGAPLASEIAEFFHAAGILVLEGYGLTETTAAITVNTPYKYGFGVVGIPIGDVEIKFAEDGEILVKSEKVFKEYYKNPTDTADSLKDGWFYTGDIGEIDSDGFLKITDRKKDLIKTAGGKMIAPQKIENLLKTNKFISQVVVYGDKMKYLVALITLNADEIKKFADLNNLGSTDLKSMAQHSMVKDLVKDIIREKNSQLASYETIKNFAILPTDFSVENGELTPSMKVKRKVLSQKYDAVIRDLYQAH